MNSKKSEDKWGFKEDVQIYKEELRNLPKDAPTKDRAKRVTLKLADTCAGNGDWDDALKYYLECLNLTDGLEEKETADVFRKIGKIHSERSKWEQAKKVLERAITLGQECGDERLCESYRYLGRVYWRTGDSEKAIEYLNKGLEDAMKFNNDEVVSAIYIDLGNVFGEIGDKAEALEYYEMAKKKLETIGNMFDMCRVYNNI
ncbi:MAG: tetratricopeptide repeat protein, partial [Thermoplasmata archaeon]